MKYYSQVKQDEFLHKKVFKNFKQGIFLDLGAFDGVTFSNTYFFEKNKLERFLFRTNSQVL